MVVSIKQLWAPQAVGTALATVYTVPASTTGELVNVIFTNTTTTAKKVRLHVIPSAGAAGTGNALVYDFSLDIPGLPYKFPLGLIMPAGSFVQLVADAAGVTSTGNGLEVV